MRIRIDIHNDILNIEIWEIAEIIRSYLLSHIPIEDRPTLEQIKRDLENIEERIKDMI